MTSADTPLDDLLSAPEFSRVVAAVSRELARARRMPLTCARGFVLSGLGDPDKLTEICSAWTAGQRGLAKVMLRRRAIDVLREEGRRPKHRSLPAAPDALHAEISLVIAPADLHWGAEIERHSVVRVVLAALSCFASQGTIQRSRASLIRRYLLEEKSYRELSAELGVPMSALRVRVHKAIRAFREYLRMHLRHRDSELLSRIPRNERLAVK